MSQRNIETTAAFTVLQQMGVPVYERSHDDYGHFIISAEENDEQVWADYYDGQVCYDYDFGVNPKITKVLSEYALFAEWINPGMLGVYDA